MAVVAAALEEAAGLGARARAVVAAMVLEAMALEATAQAVEVTMVKLQESRVVVSMEEAEDLPEVVQVAFGRRRRTHNTLLRPHGAPTDNDCTHKWR